MSAREAGIQNLTRTLGELRGHLQKQKWPLTLNEKFEAIDECRLDGIKKNKATENFSLFGYHPAKNHEEDDCEMASKVGEPGQGMIKNW
jgi:hypothetical protein